MSNTEGNTSSPDIGMLKVQLPSPGLTKELDNNNDPTVVKDP